MVEKRYNAVLRVKRGDNKTHEDGLVAGKQKSNAQEIQREVERSNGGWGLAAEQGNTVSERFQREALLSGMLRSPDPFGTPARRFRGRGWGKVYGVIAAR